MSSGHQRIKWHRNIAENFNRLSRVHERYRQTTDGRTTTYSEHEHEFTFTNKTESQSNPWQEAQLSQRDCTAGCVIVFAKSRRLELGDNILRI